MDAEAATSPGEARSDADLLAAHAAGDPDAFAVLFGRHRSRLYAVALRTTGDAEEAADALQDAMISAFRRADSFRGEAAVTTWLHRIVVNAALDRLRRRAVRPTTTLPQGDPETGWGELADPRDDIDRMELRVEIDRALAELPVEQRAAIVLVDIEGFSVADAASMLDVAEGTVKSRCSRGRARLAASLSELRRTRS